MDDVITNILKAEVKLDSFNKEDLFDRLTHDACTRFLLRGVLSVIPGDVMEGTIMSKATMRRIQNWFVAGEAGHVRDTRVLHAWALMALITSGDRENIERAVAKLEARQARTCFAFCEFILDACCRHHLINKRDYMPTRTEFNSFLESMLHRLMKRFPKPKIKRLPRVRRVEGGR